MRIYRFKEQAPISLNIKNPRIQLTLFPGKTYKLPEENPVVQRLVRQESLEDLGEIKVKKKPVKVVKKSGITPD